MRHLIIALLMVFATPIAAQTMATEFYERCIGPGFDQQVERRYASMDCHARGSCPPFEPIDIEEMVWAQCFDLAVAICPVLDDPNGCTTDMIRLLDERTSAIEAEFPERRVSDALRGASEFKARSLRRLLDGSVGNGVPGQCFDRGTLLKLMRTLGLSEETACMLHRAFNRYSTAHVLKRSVLDIESEEP